MSHFTHEAQEMRYKKPRAFRTCATARLKHDTLSTGFFISDKMILCPVPCNHRHLQMWTGTLTWLFGARWSFCGVHVGRNCQLIIKRLVRCQKTAKSITRLFPLCGTIKNFKSLNPDVSLMFVRADRSHSCKKEDIILHLCDLTLMRFSAISVSTRLWLTSAAALYL